MLKINLLSHLLLMLVLLVLDLLVPDLPLMLDLLMWILQVLDLMLSHHLLSCVSSSSSS